MKVLIIDSSYRSKGNSKILAAEVAAGAKSKGHEVETIDISHLNIKPCKSCCVCVEKKDWRCSIQDDMTEYYPKIEAAEVLIFSSPIYWFNVCGQIKQFIDRLFAFNSDADEAGKSCFGRKKLGAVLVYGGNDPFDSGCVNAIRSFQDTCSYLGSPWLGAVYGSAYEENTIGANKELMEKARAYGASI